MGRDEIAELVRLILAALVGTASILAADQVAYRNTKPGVAYVGSRACAGCHAKIYQNYSTTAMGRSMDLPASARQQESVSFTAAIFAEKLNRHYEIYRQGQDVFQTEYELDASGHEVFRTNHKLEYAIGSGVNGYTYMIRRGDYLFQAPLSYYSRKKAWDLSPGYESYDHGFNRPVAAACIACHSGQPQPVPDREGLFANPPFRELAIGCENCHGPGALHVGERGRSTPAAKIDDSIVNPGSLPARLAEDICMNCHQGGDTRVLVPGKGYFDFRPGTPLRDTLALLRVPPKRGDPHQTDLLEHHFSMQLSKCFRGSDGRLSCLTCHQIHSMPPPAEAAAYYRSRCLSCHTGAACKLAKEQRADHGDDCVACHMPKRNVQLIAHSALTNHRIVARPDEPLPEAAFHKTTADLPDLIYLNRSAGSDRASLPPAMLLQAYGELMDRQADYGARYFSVLDELRRSAPDQPLVQAALGRKALLENAPSETAIEHLTRAIELGFSAPAVYQDLDTALVQVWSRGRCGSHTPARHRNRALYAGTLQTAGPALHQSQEISRS